MAINRPIGPINKGQGILPQNGLPENSQNMEVDEKTGVVSKRIADAELDDVRPLKERKITPKGAELNEKLITFRLVLNLPSDEEQLKKLNKFKEYFNSLNLNDQNNNEIIELTALLFEGKNNYPDIFDHEMEFSNFPDFAKKYYEVLIKLKENPFLLEEAYKNLEEIALNETDLPFYAMAAHIINIRKVPILDLKNFEGWKGLYLDSLAPHLRHVDLKNLDTNSMQIIFSSLTNVHSLFINDETIRDLPSLPNCQELNCCGCRSLISLPELPNCQTLCCGGCNNLTALRGLSNCKMLNCSGCKALVTLPELPNCQYLNCSGCQAISLYPIFQNVKRLIAIGANLLIFRNYQIAKSLIAAIANFLTPSRIFQTVTSLNAPAAMLLSL